MGFTHAQSFTNQTGAWLQMNTIAMVIAAITALAVIVSIFKPARALSVYAISRPMIQPFIFLKYQLVIIPYSYMWALILPLIYVVNFFRGRWKFLCYKSTPLFIIIVIATISIGYSIDVAASIEGVVKILAGFCAFGIAYNSVKNSQDADRIIYSVILASIIPMLFGFYQAGTGNYGQIHVAVVARISSVFGLGNAYGIFLSITMCAVFMVISNQALSKKTRVMLIVLLSSMVISQVLALNRGTWLAMSGAVMVTLIMYRRHVKIRWFIIGVTVIAIAFSGLIYNRFADEGYKQSGERKDTLKGRVENWQNILPLILERPILGYGIGTTDDQRRSRKGIHSPHNDYIRLAMDIGIPGSLIYLYFLVSLALFYLRRRNFIAGGMWRYNFPMAILATYFVVISSTQNVIYNLTNFVLFVMLNGTVIKLNLLQMRKQQEDLMKEVFNEKTYG